jgi:hypothetical protein
MGQLAISGTTPTNVFIVPPGPCKFAVNVVSGTIPVYIGSSTTLTTATGYAISTIPTVMSAFQASTGTKVYALPASGTVSVSWLLSTPY